MMAPVLNSIVVLFFPIVCNAALTALITDPQSVNIGALGGVKSTRSFSTSTHRLECSTFHQTFYLNIDRQQKPFQSIAVVSKLVNRQLLPLEAFAGDNCDDTGMTDSVYAGYDRVEFKLNTGYVVIIVNHAWQHKQDGAFDPSPWTDHGNGRGPMNIDTRPGTAQTKRYNAQLLNDIAKRMRTGK